MRFSVLILVLVLLTPLVLAQDDWPMFRGNPERNGYVSGTADLSEFLVSWTYTAQNGIFGSPAVGDVDGDGYPDIVVPLEKEKGSLQDSVVVLNRSGGVLWSAETENPIYDSPALADVDRDGDTDVVFGTTGGRMYALDGPTGDVIWTFDKLIGAFRSSPLVYDIDNDNNPEVIIGYTNGDIFCLDGESGIVEWTYQTGGEVSSSPTLGNFDKDGDMEVAVGSEDGHVYILNGDGTLSWEVDLGSPIIYSTGALVGDVLYVGTDGGGLFRISNGKASSVFKNDAPISGSPGGYVSQDGPIVVFGTAKEEDVHGLYQKVSANRIYCVDGKKVLWDVGTDGWSVFSSPALADLNRDGVVDAVIGTREGRLYVIATETGKVEWDYLGGTGLYASPVLADVDLDGDLEIIVAYRFSNQIKLLDSPDRPDLIISGIDLSTDFPENLDNVTINVTVENVGDISSGNFSLAIYRRSPILDYRIGNLSVGPLEAGANTTRYLVWQANLPEGEVGIYAYADSGNNVRESDETNNEYYRAFRDDLYLVGKTIKEKKGKDGEVNVNADVKVMNRGRTDVDGVDVVLSYDEAGTEEVARETRDIPAGGVADFKLSFTETPNSAKTLWVIIDPDDVVDEANESNNAWSEEIFKEFKKKEPVLVHTQSGGGNDKTGMIIFALLVVGVVVGVAVKQRKKRLEKKKGKKKKGKGAVNGKGEGGGGQPGEAKDASSATGPKKQESGGGDVSAGGAVGSSVVKEPVEKPPAGDEKAKTGKAGDKEGAVVEEEAELDDDEWASSKLDDEFDDDKEDVDSEKVDDDGFIRIGGEDK